MKKNLKNRIRKDFLVIGSGIAGLSFALKAAQHGKVLIVTKEKVEESATFYAQGGIAAAISPYDNPKKHFDDTIRAGAGLCDLKAVQILVNEGALMVQELIQWGLEFTKDQSGNLHLGREGGHSEHRIVHSCDSTGKKVVQFLSKLALSNPNIEIWTKHIAIDILTQHHLGEKNINQAYGAYVFDEKENSIVTILANHTILATGGTGQIYPITTNPTVATGDGVAMGYRAGCRVRNLEFFQFHPTALYSDASPAFLITEALRGFGGILINSKGVAFMDQYDSRKELAPRDIVARAIDSELKKEGDDFVYLDATHLPPQKIKKYFPSIYKTLLTKFKIDMTKEKIPVVPAAHYACGGLLVDLNGQTDLQHLYAIGETASTGVHGANRLASNSLLEGLVFAERALQHAINSPPSYDSNIFEKISNWNKEGIHNPKGWILVRHDFQEIKKIMWNYVGIVRSSLQLERALRRIDLIYQEVLEFYQHTVISPELLKLRNIALVAQLTVRSAQNRHESRGLHFTIDYPENREPSRSDTILTPQISPQKSK